MSIEARNITKRFGNYVALDNVNLQVPGGKLTALLGPSGSGKTTLLRIIAGLEFPDHGQILLNGEDSTTQQAQGRAVGFVFQHYALFRHMTVFENIAFGLRVRPRKKRPSEESIRKVVKHLLELVQLDWLSDRYPSELSGGQRQRIALARALAVEPQVLLLDEPFGALDAKVRKELRRWLRRLHDDLHITSVLVTHDQEEALEVADSVVLMNHGRIEQVGTPEEVYQHPATPFVYGFLGNVNIFQSRINHGRAQIGGADIDVPEFADTNDAEAIAYVRPHQIDLDRKSAGGSEIRAVVRDIRILGPLVRLDLDHAEGGEQIEVELTRERFNELALKEDEQVFVRPRSPRFFLSKATTEKKEATPARGRGRGF